MIFPEYASVEAFAEYCFAEEISEYSHEDLHSLGFALQMRVADIRVALSGYGLVLMTRVVPKHTRGYTTSSNDRWFGPGSSKTYGGAAHNSVMSAKYGCSPFEEK